MYDEVKVHIQEMLDEGAIQPSNSPWASTVVLVQKKMGNYDFASICGNYMPGQSKILIVFHKLMKL